VRHRDDVIFVPVEQVSAVVADGELLHLHTPAAERFTITYRLKDLEARLDRADYVRLSRGTLGARRRHPEGEPDARAAPTW
jgi:DNA-binding LytR/AlgR family response regulator